MVAAIFSKLLVQPLNASPELEVYKYLQIEPLERPEADVEKFFESPLDDTLQGRVQSANEVSWIDHTFKVKLPVTSPYGRATQYWGALRNRSWWIIVIEGLFTVGGLVVARQARHPLIWVAGLVMAVSGFYLIGNRLVQYIPADRQLQAWQNPGVDFACNRRKALQLPFAEMVKHRYQPNVEKGTITDLELFCVWKKHFAAFAKSMLEIEPKNDREQKEWFNKLLTLEESLLSPTTFSSDPAILDIPLWKNVKKIQGLFKEVKNYKAGRQLLQEAVEAFLQTQEDDDEPFFSTTSEFSSDPTLLDIVLRKGVEKIQRQWGGIKNDNIFHKSLQAAVQKVKDDDVFYTPQNSDSDEEPLET